MDSMFRIFIFISASIFLISCTKLDYETIEIIGKDPTTSEVRIRGMGVRFPDGSILTSDHVVRDGIIYNIWGIGYHLWERDITGDRAILSEVQDLKFSELYLIEHIKNPRRNLIKLQKWDSIYTELSRSGSIVRQVGRVVDPNGSVTWYDTTGRVVVLSGIVLTDFDLLPGDSGAPIFTLDRELVDIVHVR
jgi:hypothetical protein